MLSASMLSRFALSFETYSASAIPVHIAYCDIRCESAFSDVEVFDREGRISLSPAKHRGVEYEGLDKSRRAILSLRGRLASVCVGYVRESMINALGLNPH